MNEHGHMAARVIRPLVGLDLELGCRVEDRHALIVVRRGQIVDLPGRIAGGEDRIPEDRTMLDGATSREDSEHRDADKAQREAETQPCLSM